jgi:uncharacterized repeat protein (TIGR04138 family)
MSLQDDLAEVLARDPRYSIHAYAFVLEAIEYTNRNVKKRQHVRTRSGSKRRGPAWHITGRELCEGVRQLALSQYGLMALLVLDLWGIRSTSDLGEIVYNLIASGEVEKTPSDSRADFDDVFDFETVFRREFVLTLDDGA